MRHIQPSNDREFDVFVSEADHYAQSHNWSKSGITIELPSTKASSFATPLERFIREGPFPIEARLALWDRAKNNVTRLIAPEVIVEYYLGESREMLERLRQQISNSEVTQHTAKPKDHLPIRLRGRTPTLRDVSLLIPNLLDEKITEEVCEAGSGDNPSSGLAEGTNLSFGTSDGSAFPSISKIPSNIIQGGKDSKTPKVDDNIRELKRQRRLNKTKLDCTYRKHNPQFYSGEHDCFTLQNKGFDEFSQLT